MRPGRIDVFATWTDLTIRVKVFDNGVWGEEWTSLGGAAASPPVSCSYRFNNNNVAMVGVDHAVYHKYVNDGNTWGPTLSGEWEEQGGLAWSSVDTGCAGSQPQGMYFLRFNTSQGWDSDWSGGEGNYRGHPTVVTTPIRTDYFGMEVRLVGRDLGVTLYATGWTQQNGMENRVSLGGNSRSVAAAFATGPNRLDVLVVGNDTRLKHRVRVGGNWGTEWEDLGGYFISAPKPIVLNDTAVAVFGIGLNGSVIHGVFLNAMQGLDWGAGTWYDDGGDMA
ncbi:hypothetical protein B0T16DRAFT_360115, partial [Cercophora newfieldiana]